MIEVSTAQAHAVAALAERKGALSLHQIGHPDDLPPDDIFATPVGSTSGFRIAPDGTVTDIGETLPARAGLPDLPTDVVNG